ncbi:MAG: phosphatidylserine/phosphatidylglycerophosphate/cardiolipin synthase family protein [Alphaproteobacteria bacterium]
MSGAGPAWWPYLATALDVAVALGTSAHIALHKRDGRSAVAWLAAVWFWPFFGAAVYWMIGVNRIARRAVKLRGPQRFREEGEPTILGAYPGELADAPFLVYQANLIRRFHQAPFSVGNRVRPLRLGDAAYPEMLAAIGAAERSVALASYIFNDDALGRRFVEALAAARARGVEVRVLIDGIGALYSIPPVAWRLRGRGVRVERFLAPLIAWRMPYLNLRSHRKIMVVDGRIGFTGGMNIKRGHLLAEQPRFPTPDVHFRIDGPAVADLMSVFADDWAFTCGEQLSGPAWFPQLAPAGATVMRGVSSGPNEEYGSLRLTLMGALSQVRRSLRIATPYFLPDDVIVSQLCVAALRGVAVDIVLPAVNNQFFVKWAETAALPALLAAGCRIWYEAPPFDHAKLAVADDQWVLFGSSNWDTRSLRLNFEFDCEAFDQALAREINALLDAKIARATPVTPEGLVARGFVVRLRDGFARLLKPYL